MFLYMELFETEESTGEIRMPEKKKPARSTAAKIKLSGGGGNDSPGSDLGGGGGNRAKSGPSKAKKK